MPTLRVGATTQRFFEEGEEHEAAQWTDTVLPPDDAPDKDPEAQFDSFDKIPKKRSPVMTGAAIGGCLLIGSAAWAMAFGVLRTGHSVQESARAMTNAGPSPTVSANTPGSNANTEETANGAAAGQPAAGAAAAQPSAPAETAPTTDPPAGPLVVPMAPSNSAPPTTPPTIAASKATAGKAPTAPAKSVIELTTGPALPAGAGTSGAAAEPAMPRASLAESGTSNVPANSVDPAAHGNSVRPSRSPDQAAARSPGEWSGAPGREDRVPPLRGYVWSPSAKALVPAEPSSLPTTDPDFAGSSASAPRSASSVAPATPSSLTAPVVPAAAGDAPGAVAPHGVVAPPSVGAAPAERPAPAGSNGAQIVPPPFSPR